MNEKRLEDVEACDCRNNVPVKNGSEAAIIDVMTVRQLLPKWHSTGLQLPPSFGYWLGLLRVESINI